MRVFEFAVSVNLCFNLFKAMLTQKVISTRVSPILVLFIFVSFCIFLTSCDLSVPPTTGTATGDQNMDLNAFNKETDRRYVNRFNLDLQINTSVSAVPTVTFTIKVTPNLPTSQARIKLILPELTPMHRARTDGNPDRVIVPVGTPLENELDVARSLVGKRDVSVKKSIENVEPGYYMVVADIRAPRENRLTEEGQLIDNGVRKEVWLWVGEETTRVTNEFRRDIFPEGYHVQPGPLTPHGESSPVTFSFEESHAGENSGPKDNSTIESSADRVTFLYTYLNPETNVLSVLTGKRVEVEITDEYENRIVSRYTDYTNSEGKIDIGCDSYETADTVIDLDPPGGSVDVYTSASGSRISIGNNGPLGACGHTFEARISDSYYAYGEMVNVVSQSRNSFSPHERGTVRVNLNSDGSFYRPSNDQIYLDSVDHDGTGRDTWVMSHEYGHAFHEKGLGGNAASGECPRPHYISGEYNLQCAFSEGFANYHAHATGYTFYDFEGRDWTDGGSNDGAQVEGAVASFFNDITDPANESFDNQNLTGEYIGDIIKTCKVNGLRRADGVDHLIACLQKEIPNYQEYFPSQSSVPSSFSEFAHEPSGWSRSGIRNLWKRNLYRE